MSDQDTPAFKVTDKRLFRDDGEVRDDRTLEADAGPSEKSPETDPEPARPRPDSEEKQGVDFASFVLSLATTAMIHLGEGPRPSGAPPEDLDAAKQMIDILGMLEQKTEGNLEAEEARLIHEVLYELRMKFLAKKQVVKL